MDVRIYLKYRSHRDCTQSTVMILQTLNLPSLQCVNEVKSQFKSHERKRKMYSKRERERERERVYSENFAIETPSLKLKRQRR